MIELETYINNVEYEINEARMQKYSWGHYEQYDYALNVIRDILVTSANSSLSNTFWNSVNIPEQLLKKFRANGGVTVASELHLRKNKLTAEHFDVEKLAKLYLALLSLTGKTQSDEIEIEDNKKMKLTAADIESAKMYSAFNACVLPNSPLIGLLKAKKGNKTTSLWHKIEKSQYTGHTAGVDAEAFVAFLFNYCEPQKLITAEGRATDSFVATYTEWIKNGGPIFDYTWQISCAKTVEAIWNYDIEFSDNTVIKRFSNRNYAAVHINSTGKDNFNTKINKETGHRLDYLDSDLGKGFNNTKGKGKNVKQQVLLGSIFFGKSALKNLLGRKYNDLYATQSKDKWCPADIVLVPKYNEKEYDKFLTELRSSGDGPTLRNKIDQMTQNSTFVPISLKKIEIGLTDRPTMLAHNIDTTNNKKDNAIYIDKMNVNIAQKYDGEKPDESKSGSFWIFGKESEEIKKKRDALYQIRAKGEAIMHKEFELKDDIEKGEAEAIIQFRAQAGKDSHNISIEAVLPSGNARGGKCIDAVKKELGVTGNDYYETFKSNKELFTAFSSIGIEIKDDVKKSVKGYDLYNRTCYRGFFGLFRAFIKWCGTNNNYDIKLSDDSLFKAPNKEQFIMLGRFANFLWDHCVNCRSKYYVIR